jgi:hypothetical protein
MLSYVEQDNNSLQARISNILQISTELTYLKDD